MIGQRSFKLWIAGIGTLFVAGFWTIEMYHRRNEYVRSCEQYHALTWRHDHPNENWLPSLHPDTCEPTFAQMSNKEVMEPPVFNDAPDKFGRSADRWSHYAE